MQFSSSVLTSTAKQFSAALDSRGLSISFNKDRDMWTQIAVGKNYAAAKAQANAQGFVPAIPITSDLIKDKLKKRNREVKHGCAEKLFSEAIKTDLADLSYCLTRLVQLVRRSEQTCLISAGNDRSKLGLMDTTRAGYLPLGNAPFFDGRAQETEWIRSSSSLVATVVNDIAGCGVDASDEIFFANSRMASKKSNAVFAAHVGERIEHYSRSIGKKMMATLDCQGKKQKRLDFDTAWDTVYSVFEQGRHEFSHDSFLRLDCEIAEAMMDHIAARFRDASKWVDDLDDETFSHTAELCIRTSLDMRAL